MAFEQGLLTVILSALIAGMVSILSIWLDKKFFSLQFEKKIADFNFFIKKKHEIYPELFARVMQAIVLVKGLSGKIAVYKNFIEGGANEHDIVEYMTANKFPKGKIEDIKTLWKNDKYAAQNEIHSLDRVFTLQIAKEQWIDAEEYYRKSIIYLSDELNKNLALLFDKIAQWNVYYMNVFSGQKEPIDKVIKEMDTLLDKVTELIRKELNEGKS